MSKFDDVLKKLLEQTGTLPQTQQQSGGQQSSTVQPVKPATGQPQPVQSPQQSQAQLKNPQAIEKIADELANINDPNKIKQILAQLMQSITTPKTVS